MGNPDPTGYLWNMRKDNYQIRLALLCFILAVGGGLTFIFAFLIISPETIPGDYLGFALGLVMTFLTGKALLTERRVKKNGRSKRPFAT